VEYILTFYCKFESILFDSICRAHTQLEAYKIDRSEKLRSVYTQRDRDRERERGFSSWNSLVICRITVQKEREREREPFFVRANDRLDCPQSEFCQKFARLFCYLPISKYFSCINSTNRNVYV